MSRAILVSGKCGIINTNLLDPRKYRRKTFQLYKKLPVSRLYRERSNQRVITITHQCDDAHNRRNGRQIEQAVLLKADRGMIFGKDAFKESGCAALKPRCRRILHLCREFPRAAERIIRMSLNPLDGVWIAIHRLTVESIGEEVTCLWLERIGHSGST